MFFPVLWVHAMQRTKIRVCRVPYEVPHGVEGAVLGAHDAFRVNEQKVLLGATL